MPFGRDMTRENFIPTSEVLHAVVLVGKPLRTVDFTDISAGPAAQVALPTC